MQNNHAKNLRKGRVSSPGNVYLITTVTHQRHPIFTDLTLARTAIGAIYHHDQQGTITTLSYVLMPNHLHWLFQLHDGSLAELVRRFKGYSSLQINRQRDSSGSVWQPAYHDHAIREDEDVRNAARYLVANPLRAGLVGKIGDYPHWDAIWLDGGDNWGGL